MRFLSYEPDQAWFWPPCVKDVLGANHLCLLGPRAVEGFSLRPFTVAAHGFVPLPEQGAQAYRVRVAGNTPLCDDSGNVAVGGDVKSRMPRGD